MVLQSLFCIFASQNIKRKGYGVGGRLSKQKLEIADDFSNVYEKSFPILDRNYSVHQRKTNEKKTCPVKNVFRKGGRMSGQEIQQE